MLRRTKGETEAGDAAPDHDEVVGFH
jgi:hypothetical protein